MATRGPAPILRRRPRRQRGFTLIIVFIIMLAMAGMSAQVLLATQGDLQAAGHDREAAVALYAAESAVAFGKDWIAQRVNAGDTASALLSSGAAPLCQPTCGTVNCVAPGTAPRGAQPTVDYDLPRQARLRFCVHNNAADPSYGGATPTGDVSDGDGILTIEGYGFGPNGATSRIVVDVRLAAGAATGVGDYAQATGGAARQHTGEATGAVTPSALAF
jgi:hypothetical protein